jgi:hypothetical protein
VRVQEGTLIWKKERRWKEKKKKRPCKLKPHADG